MVDDEGASEARGNGPLGFPLLPPRIRARPWWFPVQELRNPLVFSLEAWLADSIFGPDRAVVPEVEWMSQALLTVDAVPSGNLVEVTVFGRPAVQRRVKAVLLSLAARHREQRARAEKMEQLEEFLKAQAPGPQVSQRLVA
ncbi:oocyte-expressed protein homolog [Hippopotamus amphibius kiboko]|uniref:oocyte-expressed protein homolog n=1 Tax=Hippopotamus amphibius kiboko TaxID=575201 RepID=UPI0025958B91|nr:oocyte-expressed protein homolog [Hippopotamus amphibius kiboko]